MRKTKRKVFRCWCGKTRKAFFGQCKQHLRKPWRRALSPMVDDEFPRIIFT